MKFLWITLAMVAGPALACPADGGKDMAATPANSKPVAAAKATPAAAPAALKATATLTAKPTAEARKTAAL
jgi:hypothetical protein